MKSSRKPFPVRKALILLGAVVVLCVAVMAMRWWHTGVPYWLEKHDENVLLPLIEQTARRHGVSPLLVRALIWKESRFDQFSVGSKGEIGLMQITDGAVQDWARRTKSDKPSRFDLFIPEVNVEIGTWYLGQAARHWKGYASQDLLTLAEYNAGYGKGSGIWAPKDPLTVVVPADITYPGTRQYVQMILERKKQYENAQLKQRP